MNAEDLLRQELEYWDRQQSRLVEQPTKDDAVCDAIAQRIADRQADLVRSS